MATVTIDEVKTWAAKLKALVFTPNDKRFASRGFVEYTEVDLEFGHKYTRVVTGRTGSRSAYAFIVMADGPQFKAGDILRAASWKAPAKNKARGNIFDESGGISCCGPYGVAYLR
jgi:hypothetical protein